MTALPKPPADSAFSPLDQADPIARRLLPVIRAMVTAEAEKLRQPVPKMTVARMDAEIMRACRKVAQAADHLEQAKFSGSAEIPARRELERAARALRRVMARHGRFPDGGGE